MSKRGYSAALLILIVSTASCAELSPDQDEDAAPLPKTAAVFPTREEACRDLELRIAVGEVDPSDRQLITDGSRATSEMEDISDQLFAYEDVVYAGATECGGSVAVSVGVSTRRASVPEEIEGVPLVVFFQPPIEPF